MQNLPRIFASAKQLTAPLDCNSSSDGARVARSASEDLQRMRMPRVNVLLTGRYDVVRRILEGCLNDLQRPVTIWSPGQPLVLPPADYPGTIIIHDVGALSIQEQVQLLEWIGLSRGRVQVVSTTAASLLPQLEAGAFIDTLYYRLNIMCVEASD